MASFYFPLMYNTPSKTKNTIPTNINVAENVGTSVTLAPPNSSVDIGVYVVAEPMSITTIPKAMRT
jgi:hypothetical protein